MNTPSGVARAEQIATFSIGTSPASPRRSARLASNRQPTRRSTRQAAFDANIRILEALEVRTRRIQRRLLATGQGQHEAIPSNADGEGRKENPILLDHVEHDEETVNESKKMPAVPEANDLNDFVCAICLDCPSTLSELATISGCTHRFCFECIDTWAKTENKCPCCKTRFRTIDRVAPLPVVSGGKRDKRKRGGIGSARSPRRRTEGLSESQNPVNSRSVEDRNQPSAAMLNVAFIEQVLQQFSSIAADHGGNAINGVFQLGGPFSFTNAGGRPVVTISRAGGTIELFLADREGEGGRPGRGRVRYTPVAEAASASGVASASEAIGSRERSPPFSRRRREAAVGSAAEANNARPDVPNESASVTFGASIDSTTANITFRNAGGNDSAASSRFDRLPDFSQFRSTFIDVAARSSDRSHSASAAAAGLTGPRNSPSPSIRRSRHTATRSALSNVGSSSPSFILRMSTARSTRGSADEPIYLSD
ncbi:hypothetical protein ACHAW6_001804 [Cyclotella cf. meneghiniana]